MTDDKQKRTNPNITPNTPGLVRLCRAELEAARVRAELAAARTETAPTAEQESA